jgi:hypothetical protein
VSRTSIRGIALLAAVFVAGLVAGTAVERVRHPQPTIRTRLVMNTPELLDRLGVTPEQRAAATAILERSSPRSEAAMRELVPRLAAIADSVNAELAQVLTPAQRAKLDSLTGDRQFLLKRKTPDGASRVDTIFRR